jgi:thioesterase domain-containing protein
LELFLQIEREIGRRVPLSILYEATTVGEMAACIEKNDRPEIVFPIQSKGHRPPFFSVHTSGGEILDQMSLSRHLGEDKPFYALQAIGVDDKEMPITRMEELAARYIEAIKSVQPEGPYFIGGPYSGGIVAYEMARQLKAAGEEVALLALIHSNLGSAGPPLVPPVRCWGPAFRRWVLKHWSRMGGFKLSQIPGYAAHRFYRLYTVRGLALRYRLYGFLISYYQSRGRTVPTWLHRPLELSWIRLKNYAPQPYDGDAVLFRAEISYVNNEEQVAKWKELVRGRLEVRFIPGLHDEIIREPHVHRLATELADCIERCLTVHKVATVPDDLSADLDRLPAQRDH